MNKHPGTGVNKLSGIRFAKKGVFVNRGTIAASLTSDKSGKGREKYRRLKCLVDPGVTVGNAGHRVEERGGATRETKGS
ncbi:hypothetical protein [Alloalcanivorax marinus]|uniref:hypothetical protein n=1 Tax=Alloalcanivorax marinus TaxID=1177169 RepID=UPI0019329E5B|nr:hypothetical protein [Alloalcanivorax marinus]MBL7250209.1 hypothetical protein [Alloalcanivorax marinus]